MDGTTLAAWLAAGSGALFALLGIALVLVKPRRVQRTAFGAFAILWGALIIFGNASRLSTDDAVAQRWTLLYVATLVVVYVPLLYFASVYPTRHGAFARSLTAASLLLAPAAIGALTITLAPQLLHQGFAREGGPRIDVWGPLFPLFATLFFGAFLITIALLTGQAARAPTVVERRQALLVMAAFALYVGYQSTENMLLYGVDLVGGGSADWQSTVYFGHTIAGVAVVAWAMRRINGGAEESRVRTWIVAASSFGLVSGLTQVLPVAWRLETIGLVRTASVVLIAYAILRFELFDIDVKVKRGAIATVVLLLAGGAAIGVEQGLERVLGSTGLAITVTQFALFGGVVVVVMRSPRLARSIGERVLPGVHSPQRLDARRLEVYEAALAQAAAGLGLEKEEDFLRDLRRSLGVSDGEHDLLARLVVRSAPRAGLRLEPGTLLAGRYRVERLLGQGSAGAAWLARDEREGARVVVKTLHAALAKNEAATRAFLREARLAASLDHANVVRVLDHGSAGDLPYLVLEHVEGGTLEEKLDGSPLDPATARRFTREILAGLAHVHARGILHRDLKPANVLLDPRGTAKITDFGVALEAGADDTMTGLEAPQPKGTLATMSPENVRGLPLTPASDVYSVGAILYRCITGSPYVRLDGRSREAARAAILNEPPLPAPQGTDEALLRVARRALVKEPAERYHGAVEMLADLETVRVPVHAAVTRPS